MRSSKFRYLDRGRKQTLVLIPGWGFDHRIFEPLELGYNYLFPAEICLSTFKDDLRRALDREVSGPSASREEAPGEVSILGWSLGGFLAVDFADTFPGLVRELFLVGVRKGYPTRELEEMRSLLKENKEALLHRFYQECFWPAKDEFLWFKKNLMRLYLEQMDRDLLLEGLDYLAGETLAPDALRGKPIRFFHGREDRIAPLSEVEALIGELSQARLFILEGAGHAPFLTSKFEEIFHAE